MLIHFKIINSLHIKVNILIKITIFANIHICRKRERERVEWHRLIFLQTSLLSGLLKTPGKFHSGFCSLLECVILVEVDEENLTSHKYVFGRRRSISIAFSENYGIS